MTTPRESSPSQELGYAVLDVETTGFSYASTDRVIEIAIILLDTAGAVEETFVTLIDPDRDPGPTHVHGITAGNLVGAPRFDDIAGEIAQYLDGRVLCGHNVSFDLRFIAAEFARIGHPLPPFSSLCTMQLSRLHGKAVPRTLSHCCHHFGVELMNAHSALDDADATARLLSVFLTADAEGVAGAIRAFTPQHAGKQWPRVESRARAVARA